MQSTWEAAHSAALRELVEKGLPFSEVARSLNERFGTAYTRNATIGRARRMGLSTPQRFNPASAFPAMKKPSAKRIREKSGRALVKPVARPNTLERGSALKLRCVAITPRHVALLDLEPGDCRYPYGGDADGEPITFCGHLRREGSSYCPSHFHLTRLPEPVQERAPARTPLRLVEAA
jgi:GcrA cell cycle regulator